MPRRRALALASLLLLAALPAAAQAVPEGVRLRPGDAVRLAVRDEPDLAGDYPIGPSGEVLLPLIGLVPVAGHPFGRVQGEVDAAYRRILVDPEIALTPVIRIAVLGEVRQPGLFPVDPSHTLTDVLAAAGGLTPSANPRRLSLVREGRETRLEVLPTSPVLSGSLLPGDQIVVGRRGWVQENVPVLVGAGASVLVAVATSVLIR